MAAIVFEEYDNNGWVREYDDGTEEVGFTDEQWTIMLTDPAFGYICNAGHRLTDADRREGCGTCEYEAEQYDYEEEGR